MKKFYIEPQLEKSPLVSFNPTSGIFKIVGDILLNQEETKLFFAPVIDWLKNYIQKPNLQTVLVLDLGYYNEQATNSIIRLINVLGQISSSSIQWLMDEDDEDQEEMGKYLASLITIPLTIQFST